MVCTVCMVCELEGLGHISAFGIWATDGGGEAGGVHYVHYVRSTLRTLRVCEYHSYYVSKGSSNTSNIRTVHRFHLRHGLGRWEWPCLQLSLSSSDLHHSMPLLQHWTPPVPPTM